MEAKEKLEILEMLEQGRTALPAAVEGVTEEMADAFLAREGGRFWVARSTLRFRRTTCSRRSVSPLRRRRR